MPKINPDALVAHEKWLSEQPGTFVIHDPDNDSWCLYRKDGTGMTLVFTPTELDELAAVVLATQKKHGQPLRRGQRVGPARILEFLDEPNTGLARIEERGVILTVPCWLLRLAVASRSEG